MFWWWIRPHRQEVRWKPRLCSPLCSCSDRHFGQHLTWTGLPQLSGTSGHHCDKRVTGREAFESRWQAAARPFPIFVGMLGTRCSCTLVAAWALCLGVTPFTLSAWRVLQLCYPWELLALLPVVQPVLLAWLPHAMGALSCFPSVRGAVAVFCGTAT